MSLGTLGKKLQRDLKANPQKGLLLLLMVCGAGYFWGPILKRWMGGKPGSGSVASAPVILDDPQPAQASVGKFKPPAWEKLQELLLGDGLTKSATLGQEMRNPFAVAEFLQPEPAATETPSQTPEVVKTPTLPKRVLAADNAAAAGEAQKLNLKVSVSIGPRRKVAVIEGQVYREGESFELTTGQNEEKIDLAIRQIEPWGVLFEREGTLLKAEVPSPQLGKHDRIVRSAVRDE